MTAAAAPAATECSQGYEGLRGAATATVSELSISPGRRRLYAYLVSQAAIIASCSAMFIIAKARNPPPPGSGLLAETSTSTSFQRDDGDQNSQRRMLSWTRGSR